MRLLMWAGFAAMLALTACSALGLLGAPPAVYGLRVEFIIFGLTLAGVALFHHNTPEVALSGLACLLVLSLFCTPGFQFTTHLEHEWRILVNLFGLLIGFALLAWHFEESGAPDLLPRFLPDGATGPFALLVVVFVMSSFLDNIAAAVIGGAAAKHLFRGRVHIGYLAALVAVSNAGGSGSVLGDTTTTMLWIDGVDFRDVLHAYVAAVPALLVCGVAASIQQHRYQPIEKDAKPDLQLKWTRLLAVALVLVGAVVANVMLDFPAAGVWAALAIAASFTHTDFEVPKRAVRGAVFLVSLVFAASLMPVSALPLASWQTTLGMGFVSAVFDNIPLTKLALDQGGYDWGVLAYAVGYGGSMLWFGSSAGVAITGLYPEAKSVGRWLREGWHVILAYLVGFAVLMATMGWQPHAPHRATAAAPHVSEEH